MTKKIVILLLVLFVIFSVAFGGTLLYLNLKGSEIQNLDVVDEKAIDKPEYVITAPTQEEINASVISTNIEETVETRGVKRKVNGEAVCINSLGNIDPIKEGDWCDFGIKTLDSELFFIMFPKDYKYPDDFGVNFGDSLTIFGEIVKYDEDILETISVEEFEILR